MNWTFEQGLVEEPGKEKKPATSSSSIPSGWTSAFLGSAQEAFVEDGTQRAADLGKRVGSSVIGTVIGAMDGVQQMAQKKKAEEDAAAQAVEEQKKAKEARVLAKRQSVWNLVGQLVNAVAHEAWEAQSERLNGKSK